MSEKSTIQTAYVVCYEPYHNNSDVMGVFTSRELARAYLSTKGEMKPDSCDGYEGYEINGNEYWSVTEVQVNEHL